MDADTRRSEVRTFLRGRRARVRPQDVGLPSSGRRRVPGLRREEVAALAGVGVTWYTMFENGTAEHVSREVVDSVARALRLDDSERDHLRRLAGGDTSSSGSTAVDPLVQSALDAWITAPAYVSTAGWDVIAWNDAFALVWGVAPPGGAPFNMVLRHFGDPAAFALHGERWEAFARSLVAMMRVGYATRHDDPRYAAVMETLRRDPRFVALWERQEVLDPLATTAAEIDSPGVGRFAYRVLNLTLPAMGQALIVQVPETESAARLDAAFSQRKRREAM
jgi:transcriptional regulator with XRE-family HTH domain